MALFRFHPVLKEGQEVPLDSFARLQHAKTGYWLGDAEGTPYESKQFAAMHATPVRPLAPRGCPDCLTWRWADRDPIYAPVAHGDTRARRRAWSR